MLIFFVPVIIFLIVFVLFLITSSKPKKHNGTIPSGAVYTSQKHGNTFVTNNEEYTPFPETIEMDEYYFKNNKYVFQNGSWNCVSVKNHSYILKEINGYKVNI